MSLGALDCEPMGRPGLLLALLLGACGGGRSASLPSGAEAGGRDGGVAAADAHASGGDAERASRDADATSKVPGDASEHDGAHDVSRDDGAPADATVDVAVFQDGAGPNACSVSGAPGVCMLVSACSAMANHTSTAGHCPGPASIECCVETPSTADNPPTPAGYQLMQQSQVTPAMTAWAVSILDDPATYPMFSTTIRTFGTLMVLARVEWHPPDFQNSVVHRGVTLYVPI